MERLDRAYANSEWLNLFPAASLLHLPILVSDHAPIILKFFPPSRTYRRPYRLDNWCFNSPEIAHIVDCAWKLPFTGSPMYVLSRRLASVRFSIMQWVIHHCLSHGINWSEIQQTTMCSSTEILDVQSATSFQQVRSAQLHLLETQHSYWLQRVKLKIEVLDGLPSRFLYSRVKQRASHQRILALLSSSGEWLLLQHRFRWNPEDCLLLSAPFTELDITHSLNGMDGSKSPGPDGMENTHIILIPKVEKPEQISQYRPISLCNVIYRLASKCLANRLKLFISSVISESQQAFVPSRLMPDSCVITHEIMHYLNKTKRGSVSYAALKLDMHKAFDRVSWTFLIAVLKKFGFPLCKAEKANMLIGLKISRYAPPIAHLFYADDAFICCKATPSSFETLRDLFRCFELASGQMINLDKSFIKFSPNAPLDFKSHMASILKMRTSDCFGSYLGVPSIFPLRSLLCSSLWWIGLQVAFLPGLLSTSASLNIDSLIAAFWWRKYVRHRSIHWLSRDSLQLPHVSGGLGLKSVSVLSQATLLKNFWRLHHQPTGLLSKFLIPKYRKDLPIPTSKSKVSHPSFLWSDLCRAANVLSLGFSWKLGNGSSVDLFTRPWVNGTIPSVRSPTPAATPILSHMLTTSESLDHLFRYCTVSRHVWLSSVLGINSVANPGVCLQRWLADFIGYFHRVTANADQCLLCFLCIIKAIWMVRNSVVFDNCSVNPVQILHLSDYLLASHSQLPVFWPSYSKATTMNSIPIMNCAQSCSAVTYFIPVCRSPIRDCYTVTSSDTLSSDPVVQNVRATTAFAASTKGLLLTTYRAHSASQPSVSFRVASKKLSSVLASTTPVPIELRHSLCTIRSFLRMYVHWSVSLAAG
ncbi:uncharacterized protein LOC141627690 [Silene latifolia]|uniref:uncharacterized protein LOC141627690 n=1 Tax=Silene latifolia TaxID=37657 RepID=UPI003D77A040